MRTVSKLRAFTLMETIVAMLLTSILIGLVYSSLRLIQQGAGSLKLGTQSVNEALRFERALQTDTRRHPSFHVGPSGLDIQGDDRTVRYLLKDTLILRIKDDAPADTFHFRTDSLRAWLNGTPQTATGGPADHVQLYVSHAGKTTYFMAHTIYDAGQFIQLTDTTNGRN